MERQPPLKTEDWERIEELFHEAQGLSAAQREAFLQHACGDLPMIRTEVEGLLGACEGQQEFLETPIFSLGLQALAQGSPAPRPSLEGTEIGPFQIRRRLGEGGMGEVYLAEDTRLKRPVALKFLSPRLMNDEWAKRQLKREAQAVARLDHLNICSVYEFVEMGGHSFIVMPYVEGKTLHALLQTQPPFSEARASHIAIQIASALAEAHANGIIHRDIKPNNIMVAAQDHVKVLDFGLAKAGPRSPFGQLGLESNELSLNRIVGTVQYMSPEQLKAEPLDYRTDIFSFGVVLLEMLTGCNPFSKTTQAESIATILGPELPAGPDVSRLHKIARKCIQKDRAQRYQAVDEILLDLEDDRRLVTPASRSIVSRLRTPIALATLLLLVVLSALVYSALTQVRSLAVLPVLNRSGNPDLDYLGDGLTDTLIQSLSRISRLHVMPRTLVSKYRDPQRDPLKIGQSLSVEMVVQAEIVQRNGQPALVGRLTRTKDETVLWEQTLDLQPANLLSTHRPLCLAIAEHALLFLRDAEKQRLFTHQPRESAAFQHYLRARTYWNNRTQETLLLAIDEYRKALALAPDYAQAYAGLADCFAVRTTVAFDAMKTRDSMPIAKDYALRALQIDNTICEAHASLGLVKLRFDWDYPGAEQEFRLAISLNKDYSQAHYWYSTLLALMGRHEEAIAESQQALLLEPDSTQTDMNLGRAYYLARRYDISFAHFNKMRERFPANDDAAYMLGLLYLQQGAYDKAIQLFLPMYAKDHAAVAAPLGLAYAKAGHTEKARSVLEDLETISRLAKDKVPAQERAIIYMGLRDLDRAVALLQNACDEHFASFPYFKVDPLFDDLRVDSRYPALLGCAGLAP